MNPKKWKGDFTTWPKAEQFEHVKKMLKHSYEEFRKENPCPLADIVDVWDYWAPWLVAEVERLQEENKRLNTIIRATAKPSGSLTALDSGDK